MFLEQPRPADPILEEDDRFINDLGTLDKNALVEHLSEIRHRRESWHVYSNLCNALWFVGCVIVIIMSLTHLDGEQILHKGGIFRTILYATFALSPMVYYAVIRRREMDWRLLIAMRECNQRSQREKQSHVQERVH